jgi:hypothetical protein
MGVAGEEEEIVTSLPAILGLIRCLVPHMGASQYRCPYKIGINKIRNTNDIELPYEKKHGITSEALHTDSDAYPQHFHCRALKDNMYRRLCCRQR